MIRDN